LKKIGKKKWNSRVQQAITILQELFHPDETYIGGGNSSRITFTLAAHVQLISNQDGILGGFRLWEPIQKGGLVIKSSSHADSK
jgi:polyphosphate glucokinase